MKTLKCQKLSNTCFRWKDSPPQEDLATKEGPEDSDSNSWHCFFRPSLTRILNRQSAKQNGVMNWNVRTWKHPTLIMAFWVLHCEVSTGSTQKASFEQCQLTFKCEFVGEPYLPGFQGRLCQLKTKCVTDGDKILWIELEICYNYETPRAVEKCVLRRAAHNE